MVGLARGLAPIEHPGYRHFRVDLSDSQALTRFVEEDLAPIVVQEVIDRIGLVNNAALIGSLAWIRETDPVALARLFTVNAAAPIFLMGWLVKSPPAGTTLRLVNISSAAAHSPFPGLGDYSATKAALRLAGQTLAAELEAEGRTPAQAAVFSYEPGLVDTQMQDAAREADPERFPAHASFCGFHEDGLLNPPEKVAGPVVDFLTSEPAVFFSESRFS